MTANTNTLLLAAGLTLALTGSSFAMSVYATTNANVRSGPSTGSAVVDVLKTNEEVELLGCKGSWCQIQHVGPDGWVSKSLLASGVDGAEAEEEPAQQAGPNISINLDFGLGQQQDEPEQNPEPPQDQQADIDSGDKICFYTGIQFSGHSACVGVGANSTYLIPGWDDNVESIRIVGTGKFEICRDQNFGGGCAVYISSQSTLPDSYANKISSYQTYY